jgi:mono/diheme cytochrome c family protein
VLVGVLASLSLVVLVAQTPAPAGRSTRDGVYTTDQARRGALLYSQYCGYCHGNDLLGAISSPPPLRGREFVSTWTGLRVGDLFERIRISMPQDAPGSLPRQQNADILAFLLQENGFPPGERELPTTDPPLADIRIDQ